MLRIARIGLWACAVCVLAYAALLLASSDRRQGLAIAWGDWTTDAGDEPVSPDVPADWRLLRFEGISFYAPPDTRLMALTGVDDKAARISGTGFEALLVYGWGPDQLKCGAGFKKDYRETQFSADGRAVSLSECSFVDTENPFRVVLNAPFVRYSFVGWLPPAGAPELLHVEGYARTPTDATRLAEMLRSIRFRL